MKSLVIAAAKLHGKLKNNRDDFDETYFNSHGCQMYDSFMEGAMAPETAEYYRILYSKVGLIPARVGIMNLTQADTDLINHEARILVLAGKSLHAVKFVKEQFPGMGLNEAKGIVDIIRDQITREGGTYK